MGTPVSARRLVHRGLIREVMESALIAFFPDGLFVDCGANDPAHVGKSIQASGLGPLRPVHGPACQGSGCLDIGNIIERGQRVHGTVGALDAHRAGLSRSGIKKHGRGVDATPESIQAASVAFKGSSIVYFLFPKVASSQTPSG